MVLPNWIDLHKTYESLLVKSYLEDQSSNVSHQDLLCSWSTMKTTKTFDTNNNHDSCTTTSYPGPKLAVVQVHGNEAMGFETKPQFRANVCANPAVQFLFYFIAWCLMHLKLLSPNISYHTYTEIPIFNYNGGAPSFPSCNQLFHQCVFTKRSRDDKSPLNSSHDFFDSSDG